MSVTYGQMQSAYYPADQAAVTVINRSDSGILSCYGKTVPTIGSTGYMKGCLFLHSDAVSNGNFLFVNEGSGTSCDFSAVQTVGSPYGTAAGRGPSPNVWVDCPVMDYMLDPTKGFVFFDDFIEHGLVLAAAQAATVLGDWVGFTGGTGGTTIAMATDNRYGEVLLATTTANEDLMISCLNGRHTTGQVTFEAGKKTWMEARVKINSVTDAKNDIFCGFASEGLASANALISNAGAVNDVDEIAFVLLEADGDKWQTSYNTSGGGGVTALSATAATPTINTWHKLGIVSDGTTIRFYFDGVLLADSVLLSATNVPDGEEMAFYLSSQSPSGDTMEVAMDWIRVAQEF